jgi:hypothetical protein
MPTILIDHSRELTPEAVCSYAVGVRESVASSFALPTGDVSVIVRPYERATCSEYIAETLGRIGVSAALQTYLIDESFRHEYGGAKTIKGLELIQHRLVLATRDFKREWGIADRVLVTTEPVAWQCKEV